NPGGNKGPSNFDTRNRFVWSAFYDIPKWQSLGRFGEGWSLSGVLTLMSGHPFNLNYEFEDDYSGSGAFLDLSSFSTPCTMGPPFDGFADSCIPGTRHFGNMGRNSLLGPNYRNFDFAITKMISITERIKLQFRTDFYNLTNHPNFANPLLPAFFADAGFNGIGGDGRSQGFFPITATS